MILALAFSSSVSSLGGLHTGGCVQPVCRDVSGLGGHRALHHVVSAVAFPGAVTPPHVDDGWRPSIVRGGGRVFLCGFEQIFIL